MSSISRSRAGGFALVTVMLIMVVAATLVTGALAISTSHVLSNRYYERHTQLGAATLAGLELARSRLNADRSLMPDSGYVVLEEGVPVSDGEGGALDGVQRWTYAGPSGNTTGQYGVFGSIVSVTRDAGRGVLIQRRQVRQESFARYAYFTGIEPPSISFGGGDQIFGPVHSNDDIRIYASGATFHDEVRTAGDVQGEDYATFVKGYEAGVTPIALPPTAELARLQSLAASGGMAFASSSAGAYGSASLRLEFVAIDLDDDGSVTGDDEGFVRVYTSSDTRWLSGDVPSDGMRTAEHCGHYHPDGAFVAADDHPGNGPDSWVASLTNSRRRCYLGGSDSIFGGFTANDGGGRWLEYPGIPDSRIEDRADAAYLFPLSRNLNPAFEGVIYVDGKVLTSGVVRGRVTIASDEQIVIGDDIVYAGGVGLGDCEDILGLFSGGDVVVADNTLNSPTRRGVGNARFSYDDTEDEHIDAIVLALGIFTAESYASGSTRDERCEGALWGRGCLYLTGGVIQRTRGAVGAVTTPGGTGYMKRYSYDRCGASAPPPYFPTTGHFYGDHVYPVDPVGFSPDSYFRFLSSGG
jgi:hypothetical protein